MSKPLTRRQAITRTALALGGALLENPRFALAHVPKPGARATRRPNILLMVTSAWSGQGAADGDMRRLHMPTLARLRRDGITFENAFSPSPWTLFDYVGLLKKNGYETPPHQAFGSMDFDTFLDRRPGAKPFFFRFGSDHAGDNQAYDLKGFEVPPYLPDTLAVRKSIAYYRQRMEKFDRDAGLVIERLERTGELADTLVIVMGETSWPFPRAAGTLYDAGRRVPLIVMRLGAIPGGKVSRAVVNTADLQVTFLKLAKLTRSAINKALTQTAVPLTDTDDARRFVFAASAPHTAYPSRSIRTSQYLYIRNLHPDRWPVGAPATQAVTPFQLDSDTEAAFPGIANGPAKTAMIVGRGNPAIDRMLDLATAKRPAAELYDVQADPYQFTNLAADAALKPVVRWLDDQLLAELKRSRDAQAALIRPMV